LVSITILKHWQADHFTKQMACEVRFDLPAGDHIGPLGVADKYSCGRFIINGMVSGGYDIAEDPLPQA
jgi:hypothetical protein